MIYNDIDVLLYLGEALLQFIVVFYTNIYQSHSKASEHDSISKNLFTALLVLITIFMAIQSQLDLSVFSLFV